MAKSVARFGVSLFAKTTAFRKGIQRARGNLRKFGRMANKVSAQMAKFGSVLAGVATGAMALSIKSSLKNIDALAKLSARIGISVSDFQKLAHAASLSGVSAELMAKSMDVLSKRLGEAAMGTGEAKDAIAKLGLSIAELLQMRPAERFKRIADAVSQLATQEEKAAVASKLFSRAGLALVNVLDMGSAGIERMGNELARTGVLLSDLAAHKVEQANDAITRMSQSIQGLRDAMAVQFTSTIQKTAEAITGFAMQIRETDEQVLASVKSFVKWTAALTAGLIVVPKVIAAIGIIIKGFKALAASQVTTLALGGPVGWTVLAASLTAAGVAVGVLNKKFNSLTGSIKASFNEAQKLGASIRATGDGLFGRVAKFLGEPQGEGGGGGGIASAVASRAKAIFEATRTPMERFNVKMKELNELVKEGAINWETFHRARVAATEALKLAEEAAANRTKPAAVKSIASRVRAPFAGAISLARTALGGTGAKPQEIKSKQLDETNDWLRNIFESVREGQIGSFAG